MNLIFQISWLEEILLVVRMLICLPGDKSLSGFREKGLHSYIETCCTNLEEPHKEDSELLEKPITFYKYLKGKDAIGSFFFSRRECNLTFSYSTFSSYEKAQEALVKSLIEEYKKTEK
nr:MAG TPA: hypothetical protein [Caudoviricetes sp.]